MVEAKGGDASVSWWPCGPILEGVVIASSPSRVLWKVLQNGSRDDGPHTVGATPVTAPGRWYRCPWLGRGRPWRGSWRWRTGSEGVPGGDVSC